MAENKTQRTEASVAEFIASISDEEVRHDCEQLIALMQSITKAPPKMWGDSIIGFGSYHYQYKTGREGDWFLTGFSPRKQKLSLYVLSCLENQDELLAKLGNVTHGKSCLYVKRLSEVHLPTLKTLIRGTVKHLKSIDSKSAK